MTDRTISDKGANRIRARELCELKAYFDRSKVRTIGWGHAYWTGPEYITQTEADALFASDIARFSTGVNAYLPADLVLSQDAFDALVSFAFNIGLGNFRTSTCLRMIRAGNLRAAASAMKLFNKDLDTSTGQLRVDPVLVERRQEEAVQFFGSDPDKP